MMEVVEDIPDLSVLHAKGRRVNYWLITSNAAKNSVNHVFFNQLPCGINLRHVTITGRPPTACNSAKICGMQ